MITEELRRSRLEVITEHMATEVTKEFDRTLATFNGHPRYEIVPRQPAAASTCSPDVRSGK